MRNPARNQLPDVIPSLGEFVGIVNTKRIKALGYGGLQIARNVEIDNEKRIVRRDGYIYALSGTFYGLYGSQNLRKLVVVKGDELVLVGPDLHETVLATGMLPGMYSWDEDPNNNIYFSSSGGSSGIVMDDGSYRVLSLPTPVINGLAAINTASWQVTPFKLGKKYTRNSIQVFATYLFPDGRESAPSDSVQLMVAPEVALLQASVPLGAGSVATCLYMSPPGGSTYYQVAMSDTETFTVPVLYLSRLFTGGRYPYTTAVSSFPQECSTVAHYKGQLYAGTYDASAKMGVVYASLPLQYHLFNRVDSAGFISVSGAPLLLLACKYGLIIGTDTNIYRWDGAELEMLVDYGVVEGTCGDVLPNGAAYIWTLRGVAKIAEKYELVTEEYFSGDPGVFNHARIFHDRGYRKLVASTVVGNPSFNEWRSR